MNIVTLIKETQQHGLMLAINGEKLEIRHNKDSISTALLQRIRTHKQEIMDYLRVLQSNNQDKIVQAAPQYQSYYPLTHAQQRLWFDCQLFPDLPLYTIRAVFKLREKLDLIKFDNCLMTLSQRHPVLRSIFVVENGSVNQKVLADSKLNVERVFCESNNKNQYEKQLNHLLQNPLILCAAPYVECYLSRINMLNTGWYLNGTISLPMAGLSISYLLSYLCSIMMNQSSCNRYS